MVEIIVKNRQIEIPAANIISYAVTLFLLMIFVSFTLPSLSSPPSIYLDPSINQIFWIHITTLNLWTLCIVGLVPSIIAFLEEPKPQEVLPIIEGDKQLKLDTEFYVNRSDSMDRVIHYMRSGVSILLGIVTAVILWLLNFPSPLSQVEEAFLYGSVSLALFAVISLLLSFGDTSVRAYGTTLEEDLIPHTQNESQYIAQLREMLMNKRKINHQMKKTIGIGLVLFIAVPVIQILEPILSAIPLVPSEPIIGLLALTNLILLFFLLVMIGMVIVENLGIRIISDEEHGNV